jgi:homoserine dehydrogenase
MEVRVNPTLVPMENQLAYIRNEFNAVMVESDFLGSSMYYGKGAGSRPTAVAVVSDILDIAKSLENPVKTMKYNAISHYKMKQISDIETRYYIRFNILDKTGVLSRISGVFADHHISIASVIQKERSENDYVPLVMTTHTAKEKNVMNALDEIEKMDFNKKRGVIMRIMD